MSDEEDSKLLEFHEMGLDDRLLKAISMLGWSSPTPIQERAIPLALEGKDILSQARTGPMLSEKPDIVVGTPSRLLAHIQAGNLDVSESLEMIVIDEADLVFSFGYEDNVKAILNHMPKIYQAFLMSATLGDDVKALKKMVLHNAVILKLNETNLPQTSQLTQYHIKCAEEDKFALVYALLKLRLVRGKTILFVNNVDRCYKLRLFLEQFGIPACVLNSELPVNSRCHIVSQFNNGLYDYIIASDENLLQDPRNKPQQDNTQKRGRKKDQEFGVSRGLDFQNVSNVINFDFPTTVQAYIHRVGRTARGENKGTALSFVSIKEMPLLENVEAELAGHEGHESAVFKPYQFKMEEIEGFKYRAKDNPRDLQILRHDKNLHTVKSQPHMKHVPDYLNSDVAYIYELST
ncbi:DDX56-like protein [Mya arenaria]|uniref:RNA helicase n=1 Tax=Mya arenaria TaxID=6604 RepID=A0ABY7FGA0_MYAAR|nr:DDX56-like protein [Mya arenaria]